MEPHNSFIQIPIIQIEAYKSTTYHIEEIIVNFVVVNQIQKNMKHKVKVTVLDTKLYPEYQQQYCANPCSGKCPVYNRGDVFVFYRDDERDDYWHCGVNTLVKTDGNPDEVAGGPKKPFCSEAWDAISRYIYTGLQGGAIMKGWMRDENTMITCCNDGTRPVIFKIERIDYE